MPVGCQIIVGALAERQLLDALPDLGCLSFMKRINRAPSSGSAADLLRLPMYLIEPPIFPEGDEPLGTSVAIFPASPPYPHRIRARGPFR